MLMLLPRTGIVRPVPAAGPDPSRRPFTTVAPAGRAGRRRSPGHGRGASGGLVRAREVLAGLDQHPDEPLALGGEHIGFDVIAHHHGAAALAPRRASAVAKNAGRACPPRPPRYRRLVPGPRGTRRHRVAGPGWCASTGRGAWRPAWLRAAGGRRPGSVPDS